jgi:hypothetical protein
MNTITNNAKVSVSQFNRVYSKAYHIINQPDEIAYET